MLFLKNQSLKVMTLSNCSSDFGMMGEFEQEFRDGFIEACLHLVNRDYDALAKDFITLGYCDPFSFKILIEYPTFDDIF